MTAVPIAATDLDDDALMVRVQADDAGAFEALFDGFAARAYRVAFGIAKDSTRAEDVVQDAFVSLWRGRANYRSDCGSVIAWTLGIVRNRAIDAQRRERRHDTRRARDDHFHVQVAPGKDIAETVAERDQATQLRTSLTCLPAAQRDVIVLAYFGELSSTEIAGQLSIPLGTVKGRMRLGLQKLRFEQGLSTRPTHDDGGISSETQEAR